MDKNNQVSSAAKDAILKPSLKTFCSNLDRVRGYTFEDDQGRPRLDMHQLLSSFMTTGFQATHFATATKIVMEMLSERQRPIGCHIFLSYTSNMISSGVRESIRFLVKHKLVDCLVTTAGGIEEDLIKCLEFEDGKRADSYLGQFRLSGSNLRENGINRVGNLLVPNDNYCRFEDWIMPILDRMLHEQIESRGELVWSPSTVIERLGIEINCEDSVCFWAAKNNIPIFCPALIDGSLGDMLDFHTFRSPGLIIDMVSDIRRINSLARSTEGSKTGAIILGGGVAKHHTMNANLMRNGADYTVYINTAAEYDGSDSGAEPDEAISWGKAKSNSKSVKVHCDASLAFPLLVAETFFKFTTQSVEKESQ